MLEIINIDINKLKPYKNNPRKNDEAVDAVAESIKEFGFKVPIIVDKNYEIIAGHTRYKAAKKLKLKKVPVIYADDLSEEQVKAFRLADNKVSEIATWDFDLLNFELSEIDEIDMSKFGFDLNFNITTSKDFESEVIEDEEDIEATNEVYSKDKVVNAAFEYYRKVGFPYTQLELFECMQEINKLASLDLEKLKTSKIAYGVADTFHKHRFEGHALNMKSPVEAFENDKSLEKALRFEYPNIKKDKLSFIKLVNGTQQNSNFRPAFCRYILEKYGIDNDIYLDCCSGYGGRLVGFLASKHKKYIGTDPSKRSYEANLKIKELLGGHKEIEQYNECFEDLDLTEYENKVDIVFTSPPYFNKEVYDTDNKNQSMNKFNEYELWKDNFLKALIEKSYKVLKKNHYFILNIEDTIINKTRYNLVNDSLELAQRVGFKYEGIEKFDLPKRVRIENGEKVKVDAYESVLIFRK